MRSPTFLKLWLVKTGQGGTPKLKHTLSDELRQQATSVSHNYMEITCLKVNTYRREFERCFEK